MPLLCLPCEDVGQESGFVGVRLAVFVSLARAVMTGMSSQEHALSKQASKIC